MNVLKKSVIPLALLAVFSSVAAAQVTTFSAGREGWDITGRTALAGEGGDHGTVLGELMVDVFGADIRNRSNKAFLGDLTRYGQLELTVDIKVLSLKGGLIAGEIAKDLVVELRDFDTKGNLSASVWFNLGTVSKAQSDAVQGGWLTFSTIIDDPFALALPKGWGGDGDEDPVTFEPILPKGRTFANVLQNVDEIAFTTLVPGFFFSVSTIDLRVDNVGLRAVPAPGGVALLGAVGTLAVRRRRRS